MRSAVQHVDNWETKRYARRTMRGCDLSLGSSQTLWSRCIKRLREWSSPTTQSARSVLLLLKPRCRRSLAMVLLFLVAFVPRAIYVVSSAQPGSVVIDEVDSVSRGFLRNGTLSDVFGSDTGPTALVAPALPMAVAGAY